MNPGSNIRRIRLERGMTQAALAEKLGVSDRAVSRWERNQAAPDISLLVQLALILETSTDALLGLDPQRMQADILSATEKANTLLQADSPIEAIALLRKKSALYPNQPELMVYLARSLLALKTDAAAREALALCHAANGKPMRLSTAFGCKQVMALALRHLGKQEQAAQLVEDEMPAIFVSRELLLPRVAPPERAVHIRRSNVSLLGGYLISTLKALGQEAPACLQAADEIRRILDGLL